jgi:hypothetical protein
MTVDPSIAIVIDSTLRSPEQIAQDIKASYDSVNLINQIVADDQHSDEVHNTVIRNVIHLRSCFTLEHIIENATTEDKIAFADAATLGDTFLINN